MEKLQNHVLVDYHSGLIHHQSSLLIFNLGLNLVHYGYKMYYPFYYSYYSNSLNYNYLHFVLNLYNFY
jgi:hypothetical protein